MKYRLLVDSVFPEEIRVVLSNIDGDILDFDFEHSTKRRLKGSIFLAKVGRVEPSLQAAFIEYGGDKQGFLPFSEIHPDYYQDVQNKAEFIEMVNQKANESQDVDMSNVSDEVRVKYEIHKRYNIQDVIKTGQLLLVQVVKEERGNKGVSLTTYIALAGRYLVFMPNSGGKSGGISKKVVNNADRRRLQSYIESMSIGKGTSIILRTLASTQSYENIKRDYDYMMKLWGEIRERAIKSEASALIYQDGGVLSRMLRSIDLASLEEVVIDGGDSYYHSTIEFLKAYSSDVGNKVKRYNGKQPLFAKYGVEDQINDFYSNTVQLPSGGYMVIDMTEALIAIDINSGKSTEENNIEETALRTNLEATNEIARQIRLRDLAGLIVIDFIDMLNSANRREVERAMKLAISNDKARIQLGKISTFGLLEMSRQRLRPNFFETHLSSCPNCNGTGYQKACELQSIGILRAIENLLVKSQSNIRFVEVFSTGEVLSHIINYKRNHIVQIEQFYKVRIIMRIDHMLKGNAFAVKPLIRPTLEEEVYLGFSKIGNVGIDYSDNQVAEYKKAKMRHDKVDKAPSNRSNSKDHVKKRADNSLIMKLLRSFRFN